EQEGPGIVAKDLLGKAIRAQFVAYFPNPDMVRKQKENNPYKKIIDWFGDGNEIDILNDYSDKKYEELLNKIPGLDGLVSTYLKNIPKKDKLFFMEFALHGLAEYSMISKKHITTGLTFKDLLSSMFTAPGSRDPDDDFLSDIG
ncbi:MAG: magnesium chelatase, partial [Cyclobacteriaceae bacterium]|nr:magnesium chelatase [Cyclobacteriaceae bacterium]